MKRGALVVLLVIVAVPTAAVLASGALLDSAGARSRLAGALERATGHAVRLDGPVRLAWSLTPVIETWDVIVLNGPGYSRAALATVGRVETRVALLPLLAGRVEVRSLVLEHADVLLERDAAGRGNWLRPDTGPAVPGTAPPASSRAAWAVDVRRVAVTDSVVALRNGPGVTISRAERDADGTVSGSVVAAGVPVVLGGTLDAARANLRASAPGLTLTAQGETRGTIQVAAAVADLVTLSSLAGRSLPPLRDVHLAFAWPGPAAMRLTAGASALDTLMPGLAVQQLVIEAAAPDQPLHLAAVATLRRLPLALSLTAASPGAVLAGSPTPVQLRLDADGGWMEGQGTLVPGGAEMTVSARVPDLRRAGLLADRVLPPVRDLVLDARLLPRPGGPGLLLRGLRLTAAQGDLAGDLAIGLTPRPSLRGSLVGQRLDLDALLEPAPPTPTLPTPTPAAAPSVSPGPPLAQPASGFPFAALQRADADLHLALGQMLLHAAAYRALDARILLQDGRLRIDPARMAAPGGPVVMQLLADAAAVPPTASLVLRAPMLAAAGVAAALDAANGAAGTLELDVQLKAAGLAWTQMAATLDGHLAAALVDGEIDNQLLARLFGPALRAANLPADLAGRSAVRCLALRADAAAGQVALHTLALDTTKLRLEGDGSMNLVNTTMDLHLRPTLRIGGASVAVPVHLTGPMRAPVPAVDRGVVAPGRFGLSIGGASADPCPAALAAVRAR